MTQPNSPETQGQLLENNPYGEAVRSILENAPRLKSQDRIDYIQSTFVKKIVESAEKGELFTQRENKETGQIDTKIYSVEDIISRQIEAALQAQDIKPTESREWGLHIPRANGLREAVTTVMRDMLLAESFRYAVYQEQADLMRKKDEAKSGIITGMPDRLKNSEALHNKAKEDLGEEAVEASVELEVAAASRIVSLDQKEVQKDPYDYLRTALPPVTRPDRSEAYYEKQFAAIFTASDDEYAKSFDPHGQVPYREREETAEDKQIKYYDKFVTAENKQAALGTLAEAVKSTPQIRAILQRYQLEPSTVDAVDAIRENPDVRFEVAKILVQKLDRLAIENNDMGWRINNNDRGNLKVDPITGARMTSRLYAVNMALKMIGGEFASRLEGKDDLQRDPQTSRVVMGQHRHAATSVLLTRA